ncbi:MAG: hypothetical protein WA006_10540 [Rhodoglobus sp.]
MDSTLLYPLLGVAAWVGLVALQLADLSLTASRVPKLSAYAAIRDELEDVAHARLSAEQLTAFRTRLAALDERESARTVPLGRSATVQLWRGSPWRLIPAVLALAPFALAVAAEPLAAVASLVLPAVAYVLALAAARASVAAAGARAVVRDSQRAEIDELLREAAKSSRAPVAGLGDRVRKALHILREQQG